MDTLTIVALVSGILASLDVLCKAGKATYTHLKKIHSRAREELARADQTKTVMSRQLDKQAVKVQFLNEYHIDLLDHCPRQYAYFKKT